MSPTHTDTHTPKRGGQITRPSPQPSTFCLGPYCSPWAAVLGPWPGNVRLFCDCLGLPGWCPVVQGTSWPRSPWGQCLRTARTQMQCNLPPAAALAAQGHGLWQ